MERLTRSKIAYDLNISPHVSNVSYNNTELRFVFSSDLYKRNFETKLEEHRDKINTSLSKRFGFRIENNLLADIKLYITIEKRGFLIYQDGVKVECLKSIKLDGNSLIMMI